ncbi:MAG: baseplate J/gp47 family protein, partial [Bacteroidota bacterium]
QSGIVKFALPWDINTENTILPNSLHWLRASVQDHVAAIGETLSIHAQAGKLTFRQQPDNDLQRLSKPLAAEQIAKPVENIAPLKGILQAYPSFGGRPKETREHFYTRVSERLRHKGRAITIYDYERLVLQNFPSVYKAKCVTHTLGQRGKNGQNHTHAPGFVTLIVVPDLTNLQVVNRFAPKVPLAMLEKIEAFLKSVSSPFVRIKVLNPRYEAVDVAFEVKFKKGKSENFYRTELRKSIRDFLTPWASEGSSRIVFGGKLFQSTIINFIENQTYVDYLKNFEMKRQLPSDNISDEQLSLYGAKEEISGLTANSVLNAGKINVRIAVVSPQQNEMVAYKINGTAIGTAEIAG